MVCLEILAYAEDCRVRLEKLYFRSVVVPTALKRVMEFNGKHYGKCECCGKLGELTFEKREDAQGFDHENFLCVVCANGKEPQT